MRFTTTTLLSLVSLTLPLAPAAQNTNSEPVSTEKYTIENEEDLPLLAFKGKDNKFYVGLGGDLTATVGYDFGHVLDNPNDFIVSQIPTGGSALKGAKFNLSAQQTSLHLVAGYLPGTKYEVYVFVNGLFLGDDYSFNLDEAYVRFMGFRAGYGYGLFCDQDALPATIDHEGPAGACSFSNGLLDYEHNFGNWTLGIGVELPAQSYTLSPESADVPQAVPDIPLIAQYNLPGGTGHIRASALLRTLRYRNETLAKNKSVEGYGFKLSGVADLNSFFSVCFEGSYGKGIASYFQDLVGENLDLVPASEPGKMEGVKIWGGYAGVQCHFSPKVFAGLCYSHLRAYPGNYGAGDPLASPDQYSYGQYGVANLFWEVIPRLTLGAEYIYGRRVNMDGSQGHDNRLQAMLRFSF